MSSAEMPKSTKHQAVAAWIDFRNMLRFQELAEKLAQQDINFEEAMSELQQLKAFLADPQHILGSLKSKHGEIAEHVHVHFENAERQIVGLEANHTFDGVGRLAPEDYLRFGKIVQSKFYMGISGTLHAIADHLDTYPMFVEEGGSYDIPKSHYKELMRIYNGGNTGGLDKSSMNLYEAIKEWEAAHNLIFPDVVHPSIVDYEDVQLETVQYTIQKEESKIKDADRQQRAQAQEASKPTLQECVKVTMVSALLEGGIAFVIGVYQKKKSGKKISEFTQDDWKELGSAVGSGTAKGTIRGASVYALANFAAVPAPMASAMITATLGMLVEAFKLRNGDITAEDFIDTSESICLDVAMSAVSSMLGEILIPIPILGVIIGNTVGMFMMNIARSYLSDDEQKLIMQYQKEMTALISELEAEHLTLVKKLTAELNEYHSLAALAFDAEANMRFESAIDRARFAGADEERILTMDKAAVLFSNGEPIVL